MVALKKPSLLIKYLFLLILYGVLLCFSFAVYAHQPEDIYGIKDENDIIIFLEESYNYFSEEQKKSS